MPVAVQRHVVRNLPVIPEEQQFAELKLEKRAGGRTHPLPHLGRDGDPFRGALHHAVVRLRVLHRPGGKPRIASAGRSLHRIAQPEHRIGGGRGAGEFPGQPGIVDCERQLHREQQQEKQCERAGLPEKGAPEPDSRQDHRRGDARHQKPDIAPRQDRNARNQPDAAPARQRPAVARPQGQVKEQQDIEGLQRLILVERGVEQQGRGNRHQYGGNVSTRSAEQPSARQPGQQRSGRPQQRLHEDHRPDGTR